MKYHVLPCELAKFLRKAFAVFKIKLNFLTDILLRAQPKTVQNSQLLVFTNLHLFLSNMAPLLFVIVPSVLKNRENCPPPYTH